MKNFKFSPSLNVYSDMLEFEKDHWWYKGLRDLLICEIQKLSVKKILDAGCGTGNNMEFLNGYGFDTFGIDISKEALQICRSKGLKNIKEANLLSIPFEDNTFDLVTCMDIYGNLDYKESISASKEINRVCKKGGYIIINTSALPWMFSLHDKAWDIKQRYYLKNLCQTLKESNFKIIRNTYRVSLLFPLIFLLRFIEKLGSSQEARGDTHKTNSIFNFIFYKIMQLENFILKFINLPIGNSVFVVSQKI